MRKQKAGKKKIILGLTGNFGSGKTTVAKIFRSYGGRIIDADRIAHDVIKPRGRAYKKIVAKFGSGVLRKNKTVDRSKLARIVFNDKKLLKILNKVIHPEVIRIIKSRIRKAPSKVIVLDVPLLIESGLEKLVDKLIVVNTARQKQIERIIKKTSLCKTDILKRVKHQLPLSVKARLADFVIDNSGTIKETKKQVRGIWRRMELDSH